MLPGICSTPAPAAGQVFLWQKSGQPNIIQLGSAWSKDLYLDRTDRQTGGRSFLFYYLFLFSFFGAP